MVNMGPAPGKLSRNQSKTFKIKLLSVDPQKQYRKDF